MGVWVFFTHAGSARLALRNLPQIEDPTDTLLSPERLSPQPWLCVIFTWQCGLNEAQGRNWHDGTLGYPSQS